MLIYTYIYKTHKILSYVIKIITYNQKKNENRLFKNAKIPYDCIEIYYCKTIIKNS